MKKADLIIVAVVLAVAGVLCFYLYFVNGDSGKFVQVEVDGKVVDTLKLDEDFEKQYDLHSSSLHCEDTDVLHRPAFFLFPLP